MRLDSSNNSLNDCYKQYYQYKNWQIGHAGSIADKLIYRDNLLWLILKTSKQFDAITRADTTNTALSHTDSPECANTTYTHTHVAPLFTLNADIKLDYD